MLPFSPLSPGDGPAVPSVANANMWMEISRRMVNWLPVLSTCCILWVVTWPGGPSELAAAEIEASAPELPERQTSGPRTAIERTAPAKAYALLEALQQRHGEPLAGYVGGKAFQNRERRLPRGRYKEYDVNRKVSGRSRDAERLVIEQDTGKAYYTDDHYRTFVPLN
jgi:ribonuclease T1